MKYLIFPLLMVVGILAALPAIGQPVAKTDMVALPHEMPVPPNTLTEAYQRAYPNGATRPDVKLHYQAAATKLEQVQREIQTLTMQFYQQNPTGVPTVAQRPSNRASAQQQSSMDAATSELAQKMLTDKAFAQQFAQMTEAEQHAYIAKLLSDKGLKPIHGMPDPNAATPMPGTDVDWMTLCVEFAQPTLGMARWEKQTALQQKYAAEHDAIQVWAEAEIKKLPMISFGEYGHDYDPAQVRAIRKQALEKHRAVADRSMKEAAGVFAGFRREAQQHAAPINDALKKVAYGANYSFGLNYTLVLQTQTAMLSEVQTLLSNEMSIIEEIAQWEHEWRRFEASGQ